MSLHGLCFEKDKLSGSNLKELYESILNSIKKIRDQASSNHNKSKTSVFPEFIARNNFAVLGNRGSGKTTLLLSILRHLEENDDNIVLPEIDPDRFRIVEDPLGWIIYSFQKLIDKEEIKRGNDLCFNETDKDFFYNYEKLKEKYLKSQIFYKESSRNFMGGTDDFLAIKSEMNNSDLSLEDAFNDFIDSYIKYKKGNKDSNVTPLIFIFFDDADINDHYCLDILNIIMDYLNNKSIVTFVCGEYDIFKETLIQSILHKTKNEAISDKFYDKLYEANPRKPHLRNIKIRAEELMNKVLPLEYRCHIKSYSWKDRIDYQPITINKQRKKDVKLGFLLSQIKIIGMGKNNKETTFTLKDFVRSPMLNMSECHEKYIDMINSKPYADDILKEYKYLIEEEQKKLIDEEQEKQNVKKDNTSSNKNVNKGCIKLFLPFIDVFPYTPRGLLNIYDFLNINIQNSDIGKNSNSLNYKTIYNPLHTLDEKQESSIKLTNKINNNYFVLYNLFISLKDQNDILRGVIYLDKESDNSKSEDPYIFIEYVFNDIFVFNNNIQNIYFDFSKMKAKNKLKVKYKKYYLIDSQLNFNYVIKTAEKGSATYLLRSTQSMFIQFIHDLALLCLPSNRIGKQYSFINTEDVYIYEDDKIQVGLTYFKFYYDFYTFQKLYELYIPLIENSDNPKENLRNAIYNIVKAIHNWEEDYEKLVLSNHEINKNSDDCSQIKNQKIPSDEIFKHINIDDSTNGQSKDDSIIKKLDVILADRVVEKLNSTPEDEKLKIIQARLKDIAKQLDNIRKKANVILSIREDYYGKEIFADDSKPEKGSIKDLITQTDELIKEMKSKDSIKCAKLIRERLNDLQIRSKYLITIKNYLQDVSNRLLSLLSNKNYNEFITEFMKVRVAFNLKVYVIRFIFKLFNNDRIDNIVRSIIGLSQKLYDKEVNIIEFDISPEDISLEDKSLLLVNTEDIISDIESIKKKFKDSKIEEESNEIISILEVFPKKFTIENDDITEFFESEKKLLKKYVFVKEEDKQYKHLEDVNNIFNSIYSDKKSYSIEDYITNVEKDKTESTQDKRPDNINENIKKDIKTFNKDVNSLETNLSQSYYKLLLTTFLRLEERFGKGKYIKSLEEIIDDNVSFYKDVKVSDIIVRCNMFEYTVYGYENIANLKDEIDKKLKQYKDDKLRTEIIAEIKDKIKEDIELTLKDKEKQQTTIFTEIKDVIKEEIINEIKGLKL